jgi:hypothetical protein
MPSRRSVARSAERSSARRPSSTGSGDDAPHGVRGGGEAIAPRSAPPRTTTCGFAWVRTRASRISRSLSTSGGSNPSGCVLPRATRPALLLGGGARVRGRAAALGGATRARFSSSSGTLGAIPRALIPMTGILEFYLGEVHAREGLAARSAACTFAARSPTRVPCPRVPLVGAHVGAPVHLARPARAPCARPSAVSESSSA